jgi:hypothetical protein
MAGRRDLPVTAFIVGQVQSDPELKTSAKDNPYLHLTLMERLGFGEQARKQYIQVWAWGVLARQLYDAGLSKGSQIWASGSLELTDYVKKDGVTHDKALKLKLREWGHAGSENIADYAFSKPSGLGTAKVVDGDRESLPD